MATEIQGRRRAIITYKAMPYQKKRSLFFLINVHESFYSRYFCLSALNEKKCLFCHYDAYERFSELLAVEDEEYNKMKW